MVRTVMVQLCGSEMACHSKPSLVPSISHCKVQQEHTFGEAVKVDNGNVLCDRSLDVSQVTFDARPTVPGGEFVLVNTTASAWSESIWNCHCSSIAIFKLRFLMYRVCSSTVVFPQIQRLAAVAPGLAHPTRAYRPTKQPSKLQRPTAYFGTLSGGVIPLFFFRTQDAAPLVGSITPLVRVFRVSRCSLQGLERGVRIFWRTSITIRQEICSLLTVVSSATCKKVFTHTCEQKDHMYPCRIHPKVWSLPGDKCKTCVSISKAAERAEKPQKPGGKKK